MAMPGAGWSAKGHGFRPSRSLIAGDGYLVPNPEYMQNIAVGT
jgi:hypothetical protein